MKDRYRLDAVLILSQFYQGKLDFLEEAYNRVLARNPYGPRERSLLVGLIRGTVKARPHLDEILHSYLPRWERLPFIIQNLLRLALFQLIFHSRVPVFATVHEWVEVAKGLRQKEFVALINAVLRRTSEKIDHYREEALGWSVRLPEWLEKEWGILFPQEKEDIKRSFMLPPETYLRVNTLRISRDELRERLEKRGISTEAVSPLPFACKVQGDISELLALPEFHEGLFYPQDLGSQMVVEIFRPSVGERIIDLCCGVGGKSTAFAQAMGDKGEVLAWDWSSRKIEVLRGLASRMGIKSVCPAVIDVLHPPQEFFSSADRVFLDAPCSGLGTVRRHPEVLERMTRENVEMLAEKQFNLLLSASRLVKRGGIILYCVCALTEEETKKVVNKFEEHRREELRRVSWQEMGLAMEKFPFLCGAGSSGLFILPHWFGNDGFFVMVWKRN
ncbi:MAG: transcription antitermination factor NusB [Candidatus Caldatribacteriaceae bacterium]